MKETGIIMSGDHPKLILDGLKTMTRRTQGLDEINKEPNTWQATPTLNPLVTGFYTLGYPQEIIRVKCPYGQVGDRLWVRETTWRGHPTATAIYDADLTEGERADYWDKGWRKFPSIFLPRVYSRITLEITEVRVERVQEITEADCASEGCPISMDFPELNINDFSGLWDSLNAKRGYGWEVNPWVWVISFKVIK